MARIAKNCSTCKYVDEENIEQFDIPGQDIPVIKYLCLRLNENCFSFNSCANHEFDKGVSTR